MTLQKRLWTSKHGYKSIMTELLFSGELYLLILSLLVLLKLSTKLKRQLLKSLQLILRFFLVVSFYNV